MRTVDCHIIVTSFGSASVIVTRPSRAFLLNVHFHNSPAVVRRLLPASQRIHPPAALYFLIPNLTMGANLSKALGTLTPLVELTWPNATRPAKLFSNKEMRLLMLGLDAAGKTSMRRRFSPSVTTLICVCTAILYKLKLNQSVTTIPTGMVTVAMSSVWLN